MYNCLRSQGQKISEKQRHQRRHTWSRKWAQKLTQDFTKEKGDDPPGRINFMRKKKKAEAGI